MLEWGCHQTASQTAVWPLAKGCTKNAQGTLSVVCSMCIDVVFTLELLLGIKAAVATLNRTDSSFFLNMCLCVRADRYVAAQAPLTGPRLDAFITAHQAPLAELNYENICRQVRDVGCLATTLLVFPQVCVAFA